MTKITPESKQGRLSPPKAWAWYESLPWLVGCNYTPRTAINQLEMWQAESFDPATIEQELRWAEGMGFNTLRVFLHDKAWEIDPEGLKKRMDHFLSLCRDRGIRPFFVFFDDCHHAESRTGKQPDPKPGIHGSGWVQSPGIASVNAPATWGRLERYVTDILSTFARDERILFWGLYNEPGANGQGEKSLPLVREVFGWARAVHPSQPLTAGVWNYAPDFEVLNKFQLEHSDLLSFHSYDKPAVVEELIGKLQVHGYPLVCTEYMARTLGSTFEEILPILKRERIGAINWGFVAGKTNTIFGWGKNEGGAEPSVWFHDILRADGSPFDPEEILLIKRLAGQ